MSFGVTTDERGWDDFAVRNGGCFLQSWGWSQFQESVGRDVHRVRLAASEGGGASETVSQFTVIQHDLPFGLKYLYVPRGPVVAIDESGQLPIERIEASIGAVQDASARTRSVFARVDWPLVTGGPVDADYLAKSGFVKARHAQPEHTVIVNLGHDEEALLAAMKQKTRYNIKVAERHGVLVTEAEYENAHMLQNDVNLFWRLLADTAERDKFSTHDHSYYAKMIDVLNPRRHKGGDLAVRLMFAMHDGQAIAAGLFAEFGDTVTYLHGASLSEKRSVMAPYKLHWEVMRDAKSRGFNKYDFWGVAPEGADENHHWFGVTRFKTGFGGYREAYLGAWDLPRNPMLYRAYLAAKRLRGR